MPTPVASPPQPQSLQAVQNQPPMSLSTSVLDQMVHPRVGDTSSSGGGSHPAAPAVPVIPRTSVSLPPNLYNRPTLPRASTDTWAASGISTVVSLVGVIALSIWMRRRQNGRVQKTKLVELAGRPNVVPVHPLILPPPSAYETEAGPNEPPSPLETTRLLLGPAPRKFDPSLADYLSVERPAWLGRSSNDPLAAVSVIQDRLRSRGKVVWAALVQANGMLFQPGPMDHAASVIWSEDPYFDKEPNTLINIAIELYQLKGTDQADPEANTIARLLSSETGRGLGLKVPKRFTDGRAVQHSAMLVTRKHLPDGFMMRNLMPVWIDPESTGHVLLVPAAYWPASLLTWWKTPDPVPATEAK